MFYFAWTTKWYKVVWISLQWLEVVLSVIFIIPLSPSTSTSLLLIPLLLIPLLTWSKSLSITQSNQAGIIYFSLRLGEEIETVRKQSISY